MSTSLKPFSFARVFYIIIVTVVLLSLPQHVFAQEQLGLSISPPTFEISANPGEEIKNSIRVTNTTSQPLEVAVSTRNFTAVGESGAVGLTEEETTYSLASWIGVIPSQWVIEAGESKVFDFTIKIPVNGEPGGHFGSIVFRTGARQLPNQTGAAVAQEVGSLVLLKIAGEIDENAQIDEFKAEQSFYEFGPVKFVTRFNNTGNVHVKTRGTITISDIFGRDVAVIPLDERNVLPDAIRRVEATWDERWLFGKYNATLASNYASNTSDLITASTTFIVLPYKIVVAVIVGFIILIVVMYRARHRLKRAFNALTGKE